jgi:hypothetical protein
MSAGSSNSNLGYANENPYNMSQYVNGTSSNYSGNFSSSVISGTPPGPLPGLAGAKNNIDAAAGIVPGICMNGGAKKMKRKIKNITKQYKRMKKGSRKTQNLKTQNKKRIRKLKYIARRIAGGSKKYQKRHSKRRFTKRNNKKRHKQKGGYAQYNISPNTPTYQVAGIQLAPQDLARGTNPPPIEILSNCVNCVDNYNHYTNKGFPSEGH